MRIWFQAAEAEFEADEYALVCGVTGAEGAEHYLTFSRTNEDQSPEEDQGVYLEFDDQINGEYGCVQSCRLSRDRLSVDLSRQLGTLVGVEDFDVALAIDDASFKKLQDGLPRIFRGTKGLLTIA